MTKHLAKHFIDAGRVSLSSDFLSELSLYHRERSLNIRTLMVMTVEPLFSVLKEVIHARPRRVSLSITSGVKTNIITSVEVTDASGGDSPRYIPLVEQTSKNFTMDSVAADKAYSSVKNLQLTLVKGAVPYIPFRVNTVVGDKRHTAAWKRMYYFFAFNQEMFMHHYHKRSNVEMTFSMIKGKFGERLRSKTETSQTNELLCKILAHNLCCVIQSIYELGIEPEFWRE